MRREGEQGIRIMKRHKRKKEQTGQYLCSVQGALMGLLTGTDNVTPPLTWIILRLRCLAETYIYKMKEMILAKGL